MIELPADVDPAPRESPPAAGAIASKLLVAGLLVGLLVIMGWGLAKAREGPV